MSPERREILEQVARGDVTPEQAEELLRSLDEPAPESPTPQAGISRVKVTGGFGAIVVEGDDSVTEAEIDGPHSAAIDGDTLVVTANLSAYGFDSDEKDWGGVPGVFEINLGRGQERRAKRVRAFKIGKGGHAVSALRIRMNPSLALDVRLDAGPLTINRMHGPIRARSAAGPISIEGSTAPLDVSVNAGAIRVVGRLTEGESRIRSDAGAVRVELDPSSSVEIIAEAALGKVLIPGHGDSGGRRFGSSCTATIGAGDGTLRVDTAMGSIHVSTTG
jgi:hypothetical protein